VFQPTLDAMLEPLGDAVAARIAPRRGERALDVGCGCGATTTELARMVGSDGWVTGIDVSEEMIEVARHAAHHDGLANVDFVVADAATHPFEPAGYDLIYSRLGTMFFEEPGAAFANLHRALRRGGRLGFVCWRSMDENRWTVEPREVVQAILPGQPAIDPDGPGPFSLASADRISALLSEAGFVDVEIEPNDQPLLIGRGDMDEAIEFFLRLLPTGYLMIEPDRHAMDRIRAALRTVLERHVSEAGIWMGSATWVVRAR
jgi:SAM-dependent methyltransferase